ncbi:MAG: ferritin family protein [Pseudomonadota bacterium]
MENFNSVDEILDFAISKEQEAADYYNNLAEKMGKPWMADTFKGFAREEMGHKTKLVEVKNGRRLLPAQTKIQDLKIAEYVVDVEDAPGLTYQDALVLAMKREKMAFKLYHDLAAVAPEDLKGTFQALAQEEAKHKLRIELEYDNVILTEN